MQSQEPNTRDIKEAQRKLGQRIAQVAEQLGGKRILAEKVGISEGQIYRYINAQSDPTSKVLVRIARIAGTSLDWLLTGKDLDSEPADSNNEIFKDKNTICLKGSTVIHFESEWFSDQKIADDPTNLQVIRVESDHGMRPTLGIGDLVVIDSSKREIEYGIYYIQLKDSRGMVRRLQFQDENTVKVISDDHTYEPISLPIEKLKVLGQVVLIVKKCL